MSITQQETDKRAKGSGSRTKSRRHCRLGSSHQHSTDLWVDDSDDYRRSRNKRTKILDMKVVTEDDLESLHEARSGHYHHSAESILSDDSGINGKAKSTSFRKNRSKSLNITIGSFTGLLDGTVYNALHSVTFN